MKLLQILMLNSVLFAQSFNYNSFSGFYDKSKNCPSYTVYQLTAIQVEIAKKSTRINYSFRSDKIINSVPGSFFYNSGFDRGHLVPAEDLSWSSEETAKSYFTTNICYQTKELNRGPWKILESNIRDSAVKYQSITIWTLPHWENNSKYPYGYSKIIKLPKSIYYIWTWENSQQPKLLLYKKTNSKILTKYKLPKK